MVRVAEEVHKKYGGVRSHSSIRTTRHSIYPLCNLMRNKSDTNNQQTNKQTHNQFWSRRSRRYRRRPQRNTPSEAALSFVLSLGLNAQRRLQITTVHQTWAFVLRFANVFSVLFSGQPIPHNTGAH